MKQPIPVYTFVPAGWRVADYKHVTHGEHFIWNDAPYEIDRWMEHCPSSGTYFIVEREA